MFKVVVQSGGILRDHSNKRFETEAEALAEAVNIADMAIKEQWPTARVSSVGGCSVSRGDYGRKWDVRISHEKRVGTWLYSVVESN